MSGGTLLALAADEIVMGPHVVLGPVDPPVETIYPAASILKVVEQKPIAEIDDETLILADRARKALRQVEGVVRALLGKHLPAEQADRPASTLSNGTWTKTTRSRLVKHAISG
jgi:ClpP class serine protease